MKTEPQKDALSSVVEDAETATVSAPPAVTKAPTQWSVLRNRNYALLFWGQLISSAGTQMQIVAVAWQVYLVSHSAIALGLIGLVQAVPRLIFSLARSNTSRIATPYRSLPSISSPVVALLPLSP